ncbi:MAG TPA: sulfotransferase [Candidatus Saccharimonadales bacterium]|nr:sulfotransferase [Candidatus Saccharimonadales bacterium]
MLEDNQGDKNGEVSFSNPVFLVGVFRSGTSLLYALLNQHPQIALMYECDVFDFPETFSKIRFKRDWLQRQEFYNKALTRHRLIFGESLRGLENIRTPEDLYRTFGEGEGNVLFGEKSPFYCRRLRQLVRRYPKSSFILIWRDPVEIYRSLVRAAGGDRFFSRKGNLNRLVFYGEQMIQQAIELNRADFRICHVAYADLVDDTEKTCRKICQFLSIGFDEKMLKLDDADFSAVYPGPEHDHLRRGKIERQPTTGEIIDPMTAEKLRRFNLRWSRLQSRWFGQQTSSSAGVEPSFAERLYHRIAGSFLCAMDDGKRVLFEFLPLAWLRSYRLAKNWFTYQNIAPSTDRSSLREQFFTHKITILLSCLILAGVGVLDYLSGPDVTLAPFYLIPPALLTLIIGRRWGSFGVVLSVITWSVIQSLELMGSLKIGVVLWNSIMRFFVFQIIVLLLDRVRAEETFTKKADA